MKHPHRLLAPAATLPGVRSMVGGALLLIAASLLGFVNPAKALDLAQVPLFLHPPITPNVLVMLDNSQSMDGSMAGKMLSGQDPTTRSNVARSVLRDIIADYRTSFNWGLGSFELLGTPTRYNTFGYYLGNASTMVYTNTCSDIVDGVGMSEIPGLRCIANPEPANGFGFLTFDRSGDDADVNDVTYSPDAFAQMYGVGRSDGTHYFVFEKRATPGTDWALSSFTNFRGNQAFSATDSGWLADSVSLPQRLWTARGWGFDSPITGLGAINEPVVKSTTTTTDEEVAHFALLNALLAPEDDVPTSANLKNAARYTPLAGTVQTSRDYFAGDASPISEQCQNNYVVLATDGNPTGRKDGSQYSPSDWVNTYTYDEGKKLWTYGPAIVDVLDELKLLRNTVKNGNINGVQTYVIGMGDAVANESSVATLDEMANQGGTKTAFLASDAAALKTAFQAVVADIQAKTSAGAAAGVSSGSWQTGAALYQGKFSSVDWSGDLLAIAIGSDGVLASTPTWSAATQLNLRDWDTGRAILSYKPTAAVGYRGVAFRWPIDPAAPAATELDPVQVAGLKDGGSDAAGAARLRYVRGETASEVRNCPDCALKFRNRPATVLGDIIGSAPFYVGAPWASYYDDFESAPYSVFAAGLRSRTPYIYVGANDGMLHAFDAASGEEKFAYVPNLVFASLNALGAIPFVHRYNVDGSPVVGDVFYDGAWHTLLVSGLRAGGRGLFALDVTDPGKIVQPEVSAASIARWEFSDGDMGHVFTPPMLVKTNNGRWSVIAGNGYDNVGSGRAVLYVIDAETGELVRKIDAGTATGNGLSGPAAIDVNGDGVVDVVYAGDLNGKLWKFDLTAASPAAWSLAVGGAALFDAGAGKSITSRPNVTRSTKGGYLVTFGTGRYLSTVDPASTATQSVYGIWDKDGTAVIATQLQQQIIETVTATDASGTSTYRLSTHKVGAPTDIVIADDLPTVSVDDFYATKRGWFLDLPTAGERVVFDASIRGGRVIFTSIIPKVDNPCEYGGSGWILEFDVFTGNRLDSATFDVNGDGLLTADDYLVFGSADGTNNTSGWFIGAIPAAPAFMGFKDGTANTEIKFVNTSDGTIVQKREAAGTGGEGRVMWRVVQ